MGELRGVEIFRTGRWQNEEYTGAHLDQLVANFTALQDKLRPRLKLGHSQKQVLDQSDGQPSLGVVTQLRREGETLLADFVDVPAELTGAINAGRYRDCSVEFFPAWEKTNGEANLKTGRTGPVLTAVALLGSQLPEVKGLKELPRLYAADDDAAVVRIGFAALPGCGTLRAGTEDDNTNHPRRSARMPDDQKPSDKPAVSVEDVTALRATLAAQEKQLTTFAEQETARKAEMAARDATATEEAKTLKAQIAALEQRNAAAEATARAARAREFVATCSSKECLKLVTPAEQAAARRLHEALAALPEQVVTFSEDGKDVKRTLLQDFEALIQARPDAKALLTEVSRATKPTTAADSMDDVVKLIAAERKLDTSKPTWKRDATIILCSEDPYKTTYAHLITPPGPARTTH